MVKKYHRNFSSLINGLVNSGFKIDKILEPLPDKVISITAGIIVKVPTFCSVVGQLWFGLSFSSFWIAAGVK